MSSISSPCSRVSLMLLYVIFMTILIAASAGNFYQDFEVTWGGDRANVRNGGQILTLSLDKLSGSGIRSKNQYLFGRIDMQIKLVPGNSAGTVTAFYFSSEGPRHDEIDFEFLGNSSGQPYLLHTNLYSQGKGNREQQFYLWFDPTKNFHTYSVVWNIKKIVYLVDNIPIRVFDNLESIGVPFPKSQPMKIYSSIWNGDNWATRGGLVKIDWTKAPFTAMYRNFIANACTRVSPACGSMATYPFDAIARRRLHWVKKNFMIYNYCTDFKKFPQGLPPECR